MTFLPASVVDGALTYAESIRRIAYYATNGMTGVVSPDDLAVTALPSPGAAVNIAPGTGLIVSTYPGAAGQAYEVTNDATTQLNVAANGTGGTVVRHVLVSIRDPQYPGMPTPADPATDLYLDVTEQATLPTDRPYLWLADITLAAGASTVTDGIITPRAKVGAPLSLREGAPYFPGAARNMPTGSYADWPQLGITVDIPIWATHLLAEFYVNGIAYTGTDTGVGGVRVMLGGSPDTQNGIIVSDGVSRQSLIVMGRWAIAPAVRGTSQALVLQGLRSAGTGNFVVDYQSQILANTTFSRRA